MIAPDKVSHFVVGYVIGTAALFVGWYALIPVVIAAAGKEIYDRVSGKGTPEVLDAVATVGGGLLSVTVIAVAGPL